MAFVFRPVMLTLTASLLLGVSVLPAQAYFKDYFPLKSSELGQRFALKHLGRLSGDSPLKSLPAAKAQLQVSHAQDSLHLKGASIDKSYQITLAPRSYEVYSADFDKNGMLDLVLAYDTMGNGLAPSSHLLFLMFDANGEPFPFAADGYFDYGPQGIADLVDLNTDGKAELLYMSYDDHYWVTQAYQAQAGRWQSVQGQLKGSSSHHFPLYTAFTKKPNHQASSPRSKALPVGPQLSNVKPELSGQLTQVSWADVQQSENIRLHLQTPQGKQICQPLSWYSTFSVVIDDARSRRIAFLSADAETQSLLQEAAQGRYQATLYGWRDAKTCSPEVLWAH